MSLPSETSASLLNAGQLTLNADGTFAYNAPAQGIGTVTFTYKANDGLLDSNEVTVTITIESPGGGGIR